MVCYSHLFKNFPEFVVIHRVKDFSVVNKAEVDDFLEFPCFLHDPTNIGNLISGFFVSLKPNLYIWKFLVHVLLKPSLKDFEHYLASMWNEYTMQQFEHSLALPFFGIGIKTDLFQSCGHCWVFQIFLYMECSTLTASSFKIWNSSAVIPSLPLVLFIVMLPKAHLTLHSRMGILDSK